MFEIATAAINGIVVFLSSSNSLSGIELGLRIFCSPY
jgi:hypothetical protein